MEFSIGMVAVSGLGNAIIMLDDMLKVSDVKFADVERRLGGRLVTIVVTGEVSAVRQSVDAGVKRAKLDNCYKESNVIPRPHKEILKFLHLDTENEKKPNSESAATHTGKTREAHMDDAEEKAQPVKPVRRGRKRKAPESAK